MKHRRGAVDYGLTEREVDLVRLANLDLNLRPDGWFRIDHACFDCDNCESRIPHNGKADDNVSDCYITTTDMIVCRLCVDKNLYLQSGEPR